VFGGRCAAGGIVAVAETALDRSEGIATPRGEVIVAEIGWGAVAAAAVAFARTEGGGVVEAELIDAHLVRLEEVEQADLL
jgi:hypothetical protein